MKKVIVLFSVLLLTGFVFAQNTSSDAVSVNADILKASKVQLAMSSSDYKVTAGDIYTLAYAAGNSAVNYPILVDSTYKIRVSNLAVIDASGKTFLELKKQVEDIVTKNYPLSGVQFSLTTPSTFNVVIKGEVLHTTEEPVWALSRLSDVVSKYFTNYSCNRNVCITSSNGKVKTYDLFKAERDGDLSQNPYLRPGDVISVKKAERIVQVSGAVRRTGTYQLLENENINELINYYADGFAVDADKNHIEVTRYAGSEKEIQKLYIDEAKVSSGFAVNNNDSVFVASYSSLNPILFIEGAVSSSVDVVPEVSARISLQYEPGSTYTYVLREHKSYFTSVSDLENAFVIRGEQIIPLELNKILYDSSYSNDLAIEPYDTLRIPFKQYFVTVAGAVLVPGRYPYIPDRTWDYYVGLAGGIIDEKNKKDSVKIIDIKGNELSKTDIITPETTITALANSGLYKFNLATPVITTTLSIVSTTLAIIAAVLAF